MISIIKINQDKNGRFTFGIFEKPGTKVLSCCNDGKIVAFNKEGKPKGALIRKVYNSSNNNLVIKTD